MESKIEHFMKTLHTITTIYIGFFFWCNIEQIKLDDSTITNESIGSWYNNSKYIKRSQPIATLDRQIVDSHRQGGSQLPDMEITHKHYNC